MGPWPPDDSDERSSIPRILPPALLEPTYQNRLRTIGRHLDVERYRSIVLLEVEGGFVLRAVHRRARELTLLEFSDDDFAERMILATEARGEGERAEYPSMLAPTGYEDLLRAIGRWLDQLHARQIVVAEAQTALIITGQKMTPDGGIDSLEATLDLNAITELLDDSFRLRSNEHEID